MRRPLLGTCVIVAFITAVTGFATPLQEEWSKKPFDQWTKTEAEKVLTDSPWALPQTIKIKGESKMRRVAGAPVDVSGGSPTVMSAEMGGAEAPIDFTFTLRLRSSKRIREALVRLKRIEANYDKMSAEEQSEFDAQPKIKGLLECPTCADNYVLTLSAKSSEAPGADAAFTVFKGGRLADLQRYVFIANNRGERRTLIHFVPPRAPGDEAVFYFPRLNDKGEPLLTPADKELIANFTNNTMNLTTNFRVDVSKLITNGQVDF
jgi:hypothetical protein